MSPFKTPRWPPHCPNAECDRHREPPPDSPGSRAPPHERWFSLCGSYRRQGGLKRVQRFRCRDCRRTFSMRTFSLDDWYHLDGLTEEVAHALVSCAAYRQVARARHVSVEAVRRRAERLGRHCLLLHETLRPRSPPQEPLSLDGFESFAHSQYEPHHLNTIVGTGSHYTYGFSFTSLRRKGRMTRQQRRRRAQLEALHRRADPRGIERAIAEHVRSLWPGGCRLTFEVDGHPAYPRAFRLLPDHEIDYRVTSSKERRTASNPLFPSNRLDLLLRHFSANHERETVAFAKRNDAVVLRAWVTVAYCNYVKRFSEKDRDSPTPAQALGLLDRALAWDDVLAVRLFPARAAPCAVHARQWRQEVPTLHEPRSVPPTWRYAA